MIEYPEAPRLIPATDALLTDHLGSILAPVPFRGDFAPAVLCGVKVGQYVVRNEDGRIRGFPEAAKLAFDPSVDAVRDHLARRLALPRWHLDTPGGLSPEVSAGLIACSVARVGAGLGAVVKLLPAYTQAHHQIRRDEWDRLGANDGRYIFVRDASRMSGDARDTNRVLVPRSRWHLTAAHNRSEERDGYAGTRDAAKDAADAAALADGLALTVEGGLLLPWPDGTRFWRIE